jgi:hypothetical protein
LPVASTDGAAPAPDARRHARIETAIPAALHFDQAKASVVIGNLSPAGAMVETSSLPSEGDSVHLVRGELCAQARIVWCSADCCGLEFSGEIDLPKWLAPASHAGQSRVDEIIAMLKAGAAPEEPPEAGASAAPKSSTIKDDLGLLRALLKNLKDDLSRSSETVDLHSSKLPHLDQAMEILSDPKLLRLSKYQLVDELGGVLQLLVEVEDELAHTKDTVARHGYKLQHLDLAMQMLTELGSELITGSEESLSTSPRLQNLRSVCENALKPPEKKPS